MNTAVTFNNKTSTKYLFDQVFTMKISKTETFLHIRIASLIVPSNTSDIGVRIPSPMSN